MMPKKTKPQRVKRFLAAPPPVVRGLVLCCAFASLSACTGEDGMAEAVALRVDVEGAGDIVSRPAGVECGAGVCSGDFFRGDVVQLAALPLIGWVFDSWTGDCIADVEAPNFASIEVQGGNDDCTANFRRWEVGDPLTDPVNFILEVEGPGSVHVTPGGEICRTGETCSVTVQRGSRAQLEVDSRRPAFLSWGGGCSGSNPSQGIDVNEDTACTATFDTSVYFPFRFEVTGEGTVMSTPPGIECGNGKDDCEYEFREGTPVIINAYPSGGWSFQEWGHQCIDAQGNGITTPSLNAGAVYGYACTALFVEGGVVGPNVPAAWICSADFYGTGDGCDCGCGAFDPDCPSSSVTACEYCAGCADGSDCPANISPFDNSTCDDGGNVPANWTCSESYYGDSTCDCGCGALDIDCATSLASSCDYCIDCGSCDNVNPSDNTQCL